MIAFLLDFFEFIDLPNQCRVYLIIILNINYPGVSHGPNKQTNASMGISPIRTSDTEIGLGHVGLDTNHVSAAFTNFVTAR